MEMDGKKFDKILRISKQYIEIHRQRVQKTEEYLAKYGYQKPGHITGLLLPCVIFPPSSLSNSFALSWIRPDIILVLDTGSRPVLNSPPTTNVKEAKIKLWKGGGEHFPIYATIRWLPYIPYYTVAVYFYRKCVGKTRLISVINNLIKSS